MITQKHQAHHSSIEANGENHTRQISIIEPTGRIQIPSQETQKSQTKDFRLGFMSRKSNLFFCQQQRYEGYKNQDWQTIGGPTKGK